jgi:hypothetical protein
MRSKASLEARAQVLTVIRPSTKPNLQRPRKDSAILTVKSLSSPTKQSPPTEARTRSMHNVLVITTATGRRWSSSRTPNQEQKSSHHRMAGSRMLVALMRTVPVVKPRSVGLQRRGTARSISSFLTLEAGSSIKMSLPRLVCHFFALRAFISACIDLNSRFIELTKSFSLATSLLASEASFSAFLDLSVQCSI